MPCERVARPSGLDPCSTPATAATGTQGSIACLSRTTTPVPTDIFPSAQLTVKPAQASGTEAPSADPTDKPSTASAAEAPTTDGQAGSKSSNHCYHTPCYHTPCRLPGVWQQNLPPLIYITPISLTRLHAWSAAAKLLCNHRYYTHYITSPVIRLTKSQNSSPDLSPGYAVYHTPGV